MKPTYEELEARLIRTETALARTQELLAKALERIVQLEEQINKNSKNSSKPPSGDQKANTTNVKKKKSRRSRKGVARAPLPPERVDAHVECTRKNCPHCDSISVQLSNEMPVILQQIELPEVKAIVTEYQLLKYRCRSCGKSSTAALPEGVPDSAFGTKLMSLLVTLTGVFHLAKREALQLIKDLYDVDIGLGSVPNIEEKVSTALEPIYQRIHVFIIEGVMCKHFDETSWRSSGKRHFVWIACCEQAAFYMIDPHRSAAAFRKLLGRDPSGLISVTDRYKVYDAVGKIHQYCLAHLIRDFKAFAERSGLDKEIGRALEDELRKTCRIHKKYRDGKIPWDQRNRRLEICKQKVEIWLEDGMANGSNPLSSLCERLLNDFDKMWIFMNVPGMEPTNNLAERDLRKLVIWRKKSYGTRSTRGQRFVERITTVSQTVKRQSKNILRFIQDVLIHFYRKTGECKLNCVNR